MDYFSEKLDHKKKLVASRQIHYRRIRKQQKNEKVQKLEILVDAI